MPQFDISKFSSQIFWFVLCFIILYYFASTIILPRIREILEERKKDIDSNLSSTADLEKDLKDITAKTDILRKEATAQYRIKLEEATQEAATQREKLLVDVKDKIEIISKKSQEDLEKFIASTKEQSQSAVHDLVKNIKSKLFNIS